MTDVDHLIQWKTNAWKDPNMVAWYSGRMVETAGTNALKNAVEVDLCTSFAVGPRVLDVGIGTGRGSLPLARHGYDLTGIDSSQSMLDETRRLAGDIPVTLKQGDVEKLPFGDAEFNTLLSLNVVVHFPHWRNLLAEWKRVLVPGGRMIFDVHSLDNYRISRGAQFTEESLLRLSAAEEGGFSRYMLRVAANDMVAEADARGLKVVDIVPYGAFLGGGNTNFLIEDMEGKWGWRRLLSWLAADKQLHAFALFLEQEFIARLSTVMTGRYMVILENQQDAAANQEWLTRNDSLNQALASAGSFENISPYLKLSPDDFLAQLNAHLTASTRNFVFFYNLCRKLHQCRSNLRLDSFLDATNAQRYADWHRQEQADQEAVGMIKGWYKMQEMKETLEHHGVSLGEGMEYFLMERVLADYMGMFSGVRS